MVYIVTLDQFLSHFVKVLVAIHLMAPIFIDCLDVFLKDPETKGNLLVVDKQKLSSPNFSPVVCGKLSKVHAKADEMFPKSHQFVFSLRVVENRR